MKHSIKTTIILLLLFLISQYIGLAVVNAYIDPLASQETGSTQFTEIPLGERPQLEQNTSYFPIILAILIGTALMLGIIKLGATKLFKAWFFLAIVITLTTSLGAINTITTTSALTIAIGLAIWRIYRPNPIIHNATEPLIYAGIAAIFVPILNLFSVSILLILIAIYDAWAVWGSKHMVTLAKQSAKQNLFAGLAIPNKIINKKTLTKFANKYLAKTQSRNKSGTKTQTKNNITTNKQLTKSQLIKLSKKIKVSTAILGGGDIAFPLLFAGVLLKDHTLTAALIAPLFALIALIYLFTQSKPGKFYPAMPYISSSCLIAIAFFAITGLL